MENTRLCLYNDIVRVEFTRSENPNLHEREFITVEAAQSSLNFNAKNAESYEKTWYEVEFADGATYNGRIDLNKGSKDLLESMALYLTYYGGLRKTRKESIEDYLSNLSAFGKDSCENEVEFLIDYIPPEVWLPMINLQ